MCPTCRTPIPPDAPEGLCPSCLFGAARPTRIPEQIGDFAVEAMLGRGGMGSVYRVRQRRPDRVVALKIIHAEIGDEAERRFRTEIDAVAKLDHAHIVPIYEVGEHDGRLFFTMKLIDGGTLAEKAASFRDPRHAARIVTPIARAIQHAHERGVLHRDLKPSNILLDEVFNPYVTDFGVAKLVGRRGDTIAGSVFGTPEYMSPEQARGDEAAIGPASDVWSLGAILYELLTGSPPFRGVTIPEILTRVVHDDPAAPRTIAPAVGADLETVCLTCLRKDPAERYASVGDLVDDLRRVLDGEPIAARASSRLTRAWSWARRHPLVAGTLAGIVLLSAVLSVAAISVARDQREELRASVLDTNAALAQAHASGFLLELSRLGDRVESAARDPAILALAEKGAIGSPEDALVILGKGDGERPFASLSLFRPDGRPIARWPRPNDAYFEHNFSFRDYFRGAESLAVSGRDDVYVSRSYVSFTAKAAMRGNKPEELEPGSDGYRLSLATPVRGASGQWTAVLLASVAADASLGRIEMDATSGTERTIALLGPHDRERAEEEQLPDGLWVLFHPRLTRGKELAVTDESVRKIASAFADLIEPGGGQLDPVTVSPLVDDDYRDAASGTDERFLAGFYPVGGTGYLVAVQTPWREAVSSNRTLARRLATRAGIPLAIGAVLVGAALVTLTRRRP